MTGRAWLAIAGVALAALILSGCSNEKSRNTSEEFTSAEMSCQRYQEILVSGYEYQLEDGQWVVYAYNGDRYPLTYNEALAGYIFDPCNYQNRTGDARRNRDRSHSINNRDSRYQRWLKDHSN